MEQCHGQEQIRLPGSRGTGGNFDRITLVRHMLLKVLPQEGRVDHVVDFNQEAQSLDQ